jgi:NAD(P)-dependent dehydrogenase (short-subunit alcohol dehydrogenase family)
VAAALVTGASRKAGIAAAVALALAHDGWALALTGYPPHDAREGWSLVAEEPESDTGPEAGSPNRIQNAILEACK